jgi:hypothetical protein
MNHGELRTAVGELDKYYLVSGSSQPGSPDTVAIWTTVALSPEFLQSPRTDLTEVGWKTLEDYIRERSINVGARVPASLWIRVVRRLPDAETSDSNVEIADESKEWPCFTFCAQFGIAQQSSS